MYVQRDLGRRMGGFTGRAAARGVREGKLIKLRAPGGLIGRAILGWTCPPL
jgi:hypothetical protein